MSPGENSAESKTAEDLQLAEARHRMVEGQLRARHIFDTRVLSAMEATPREEFVPRELWEAAYDDCPLPIGHGQTISQPFTVAYMVEALQLQGGERVLEVGTGSGYGAAVLSRLAKDVYTIERIAELARRAQATLERLGYDNVHVRRDDGTLGLPGEAPFDAIVVTAAAAQLPAPYVEQFSAQGRIVIPVGARLASQRLERYRLEQGNLIKENLGAFVFVPLIGKYGWDESWMDSY